MKSLHGKDRLECIKTVSLGSHSKGYVNTN